MGQFYQSLHLQTWKCYWFGTNWIWKKKLLNLGVAKIASIALMLEMGEKEVLVNVTWAGGTMKGQRLTLETEQTNCYKSNKYDLSTYRNTSVINFS